MKFHGWHSLRRVQCGMKGLKKTDVRLRSNLGTAQRKIKVDFRANRVLCQRGGAGRTWKEQLESLNY